ncbi:MAG TPA: M20/M25/M40 family metallo-hydrolase [Candidatus Saccharimonadales bacterium]|jgi:acetylornithine deacetylase/succinyl-diaminopimelate desuccinylase-like protein|nr:M20/M25/M40 family metallo-hydrolase [Candidatus Saccharimonadales bacterium]
MERQHDAGVFVCRTIILEKKMTTYTTPLALAKRLIALPSYVDDACDETCAQDFLADYLRATFPEMSVEKQYIAGSRRYNLLLKGNKNPKLFALGHIDTVQPKAGWRTDPLAPTIRCGKLYGLGAADMKSSLAAFLWAVAQEKRTISLDDLAILIYVDEEYDFAGIRRFVGDAQSQTYAPRLTLSLDGELAVGSGCRGLIEIRFAVTGKSGHAANPALGINAITESMAAITTLARSFDAYTDVGLGSTTLNVAAMRGGVRLKEANGVVRWLKEGNVIPDTAEIVLEVRPAIATVDATYVMTLLREQLSRRGLILGETTVRHDISPWPACKDKKSIELLKKVYNETGVPFRLSDRKLQGYIDAQMVAESIAVPTFIIGTGGENKHGANECVPTANIDAAAQIYRGVLRKVLS